MVVLPAAADTLDLTVVDAGGAPIPGAVVLIASDKAAKDPISFSWPNEMAQKDIQFSPYVLIVPVGSEVSFPNRDRVRHHVYSFSKGNRFELKLYGRDETRSATFSQPGVVAVGCNIHDGMIGYIRVVDTPAAAQTDASGHVTVEGVSAGQGMVTIWHPDFNGGKDLFVAYDTSAPAQNVTLGAAPGPKQHAHK